MNQEKLQARKKVVEKTIDTIIGKNSGITVVYQTDSTINIHTFQRRIATIQLNNNADVVLLNHQEVAFFFGSDAFFKEYAEQVVKNIIPTVINFYERGLIDLPKVLQKTYTYRNYDLSKVNLDDIKKLLKKQFRTLDNFQYERTDGFTTLDISFYANNGWENVRHDISITNRGYIDSYLHEDVHEDDSIETEKILRKYLDANVKL